MPLSCSNALFAFTLSASLLFFPGCSDSSKSLLDSKIRAVKVNMSPMEVKAILGEPQEIETTSYLIQINAEYHRYNAPVEGASGAPSAGILYLQDKVWRIDSPLTSTSSTP